MLLVFVGALAFSPWYMFDKYVLPDLSGLKAIYGSAEELTNSSNSTSSAYR